MKHHDRSLKTQLFILEGNIGAGKSTFLNILSKKLSLNSIQEPTDRWQSVGKDDNLLDLFYKDMKRWAYTFQSYAFISRIETLLDNKNLLAGDICTLERSVFCDRFCFAKNCYEAGLMLEVEWNIYKEWFSWLVENFVPQPLGFIYLKTDPKICHERLLKRNRFEESKIPVSYLASLHEKHEDWLIHKKESLSIIENVPVLTLDCTQEFEKNEKYQDMLVEKVSNFINQHKLSNDKTTQKYVGTTPPLN